MDIVVVVVAVVIGGPFGHVDAGRRPTNGAAAAERATNEVLAGLSSNAGQRGQSTKTNRFR